MKIDNKNKTIYLDKNDSGWNVVLLKSKSSKIPIKVVFGKKGFGLQVFNKGARSKGKILLTTFIKDQVVETDYIGVWKLNISIRKQIAEKIRRKALKKFISRK